MMKLSKNLKGIFLVILFLIIFTFGYSTHLEKNQNSRSKSRDKLMKDFPVPKNAIELELKFSFPSDDLENMEIFFNAPRHIGHDSSGNIYVTDQREHRILKFDSSGNFLQKFGQIGQGPGDLSLPHIFFITKDDILIVGETGNMRFQFFDKQGRYLKSFKIFKGYQSWIENNKGYIFTLPTLRKNSNHLIEVLSQEGEVLSSFGKPLSFKYDRSINNYAQISINQKGELFVAFRFYPIVRKYSQKGELLAEFKIDHKLLKKLEKDNLKNQAILAKRKRASYKPVTHSLRASDDGFYIFHNYPRIEILEFDNNGRKRTHYWNTQNFPYLVSSFIVLNKGSEKLFYIVQTYPNCKVDVFGQK